VEAGPKDARLAIGDGLIADANPGLRSIPKPEGTFRMDFDERLHKWCRILDSPRGGDKENGTVPTESDTGSEGRIHQQQ
jgi:hypothetical protein